MADGCGIANGAILYSQGKITIGRWSVISQGAHLVTGTHDYNDPSFPLITKPIRIGDQAWIAAEAFIHPGVTIGGELYNWGSVSCCCQYASLDGLRWSSLPTNKKEGQQNKALSG